MSPPSDLSASWQQTQTPQPATSSDPVPVWARTGWGDAFADQWELRHAGSNKQAPNCQRFIPFTSVFTLFSNIWVWGLSLIQNPNVEPSGTFFCLHISNATVKAPRDSWEVFLSLWFHSIDPRYWPALCVWEKVDVLRLWIKLSSFYGVAGDPLLRSPALWKQYLRKTFSHVSSFFCCIRLFFTFLYRHRETVGFLGINLSSFILYVEYWVRFWLLVYLKPDPAHLFFPIWAVVITASLNAEMNKMFIFLKLL